MSCTIPEKIIGLSPEIQPWTETIHEQPIGKLFKIEQKTTVSGHIEMVLDITKATIIEEYWSLVIEYLLKNIESLEGVTYMDFSNCSSFSLRQLVDCYLLFQRCQGQGISFPIISINNSQAALQLFRKEFVCECRLCQLSYEELKQFTLEECFDILVRDHKVPFNDISKEEFLVEISDSNGVDETFLQSIQLSQDETLYDSLKSEINLDSSFWI